MSDEMELLFDVRGRRKQPAGHNPSSDSLLQNRSSVPGLLLQDALLQHPLSLSVQRTAHYNYSTTHRSLGLQFYQFLYVIKVFYLPTDAQQSCFKRILKFTLEQLLHVSVQSPSSGSVLFERAKVIVIKIIS
jgi:hypothetical protein